MSVAELARDPLASIAAALREAPGIAEHVVDPTPVLSPRSFGRLVAAGPRAAADPDAYAEVVEAVYEGYLCHYGEARLVSASDPDLCLLAGDLLYALGLDRLAALADLEAVAELADLISLCAVVHAAAEPPEPAFTEALWAMSVEAIGWGPTAEQRAAKEAIRAGERRIHFPRRLGRDH
jgi:hypothetical protein